MAARNPRLSLVIPAYREGPYIRGSLRELAAFVRTFEGGSEVIVVDDGSDDDTFEVVRSMAHEWPAESRLRVLRHGHNRGKGAAVRTGMLTVQGEVAVFTDADLAYGTVPVLDVVEAIEDGTDVACGQRLRHFGIARSLSGWVFGAIVRAIGLTRALDPQCGLKGFRHDAAAIVFGLATVEGFAFDVELFHIAALHHLTVRYVPVDQRRQGHSSVNMSKDVVGMLKALRGIRANSRAGLYEVPAPKPRPRKSVG